MLKSVRLVDAVQTQLIYVPDNGCGHVRTMLLVYGTSTNMMECHKCRECREEGRGWGGGGGGVKRSPGN